MNVHALLDVISNSFPLYEIKLGSSSGDETQVNILSLVEPCEYRSLRVRLLADLTSDKIAQVLLHASFRL